MLCFGHLNPDIEDTNVMITVSAEEEAFESDATQVIITKYEKV